MRGIFPLSIAFSGSHISLYWSLGLSFLFLGLNWGTGAGYASGGNLSGTIQVPRKPDNQNQPAFMHNNNSIEPYSHIAIHISIYTTVYELQAVNILLAPFWRSQNICSNFMNTEGLKYYLKIENQLKVHASAAAEAAA